MSAPKPQPLPKWRSHKIVEAAQINAIEPDWLLLDPGGSDATRALIRVPIAPGLFARGRPKLGDYFVRYENADGSGHYDSWSPKAEFEAGYTRLG